MSSPNKGYTMTLLHRGGVEDDFYTRRTTHGIVTPDRKRALRVQAECRSGLIGTHEDERNGYINTFRPVSMYLGDYLAFEENDDTGLAPESLVVDSFTLEERGLASVHTLETGPDKELSAEQEAAISLIVGISALNMYDQVRGVLGG